VIRAIFGSDAVVDAHGFRIRGREVTRVEALSDAVFGFAITLLVVSLEMPKSFDELMVMMGGFVAFAATFAMLIQIWYQHYVFFHRYAMQDFTTIVLNGILLFVVVFYIYPLKFMFTLLFSEMLGIGPRVGMQIENAQIVPLMVLYSLSVVIVFAVFTLMFLHAYRRRAALGLDELEVHLTRVQLRFCLIWMATGLVSIALAWFGGVEWVPVSGMIYAVLGPAQGLNGWLGFKRAPKRELGAEAA
jgi:uncharacterized membrane protein